MIVTRQWLNEWINLNNISTKKLCEVLNNIGLEVDSVTKYRVTDKIVVGKVTECQKHPDADKLSVCQVDVGEKTLQIVCGAKNVAKGQFVPVAVVGANLGGGFVIKDAVLRGVESHGMICSSKELGLPELNDGIWVLDESLGKMETGKSLKEFPLINDDVIDIELTANRGDCLSIHGVARDLSVALNLSLKDIKDQIEEDAKGIGRVVKFDKESQIDASLLYRHFKKENLNVPALIDLRLGFIEELSDNKIKKFINYAMHTTGVLLRCYNAELFEKDQNGASHIHIKKDKNNFDVVANNKNIISIIGLYQDKKYFPEDKDRYLLAQASYIDPDIISKRVMGLDVKKDDEYFYRSSRGSEPDLAFGIDYLMVVLQKHGKIELYSGVQKLSHRKEKRNIILDFEKVCNFIGKEISKSKILDILRRLGFEINSQRASESIIAKVPLFRTDIKNDQDVIEEIVRIIGINNIDSNPYFYYEKNIFNDSYFRYQKRRVFRQKAASNGFFESVHYCFTNKEKAEKYGFETLPESLEIVNPITNEMNTLRSTLVLNLLESVQRNIKKAQKSVRLFELGTVFDNHREESERLAFIFSGEVQKASITNHGKPPLVDFFSFARKISDIIGDFEIKANNPRSSLFSPYEYGEIIKEGKNIGYIARIALGAQKDYSLPKTYVCEIDFEALPYSQKKVKGYSKFPSTTRDLSIVIPKNLRFISIREFLEDEVYKEIKSFYPIDLYESEELGDKISLTLRFEMQSFDKTLTEEEINKNIDMILEKLKNKFAVEIR